MRVINVKFVLLHTLSSLVMLPLLSRSFVLASSAGSSECQFQPQRSRRKATIIATTFRPSLLQSYTLSSSTKKTADKLKFKWARGTKTSISSSSASPPPSSGNVKTTRLTLTAVHASASTPKSRDEEGKRHGYCDDEGGHDDNAGVATTKASTSILNEVMNVLKSTLGAGGLSLPAGIAAFGNAPSAVFPAIIIISLIGATSAYTFSLVGRVCSMTGATSYRDAWKETCGTTARGRNNTSFLIALSIAFDCFVWNLSYSIILADSFRDVLSTLGITSTKTTALLLLTVFILLPPCFSKKLSSLAPFSFLGVMGMTFTLMAIAKRYFDGSYAVPDGNFVSDMALELRPWFGDIGAIGAFSAKPLVLVCILSTAYISHFNAPRFYRELENGSDSTSSGNNTLDKFQRMTICSFAVSTFMLIMISVFGFLTFGQASNGLLLNNYSGNDLLMRGCWFAVKIALVTSYPLIFIGTRDNVLDLLQVESEKRTSTFLNQVSLSLVAVITAIALKFDDISFVASLSGAILSTLAIFVYPTLMFRRVVNKMGDKATAKLKGESLVAACICAFGFFLAIIGALMAWWGVDS